VRKPLPAEVLALIPDGIEKLILRCVVCGLGLPASRRAVGDHAGACHKVRVLHRRYMIQLSKCISCLHPSTPAEREDYKAWRKSRGDIRQTGGRPKKLPVASSQLPEKLLDNHESDFGTPSVVVEGFTEGEKAQDMVSKNVAIRGSGAGDLAAGNGLAPAVETEPCLATPRTDIG
jgi:hypothetical protein